MNLFFYFRGKVNQKEVQHIGPVTGCSFNENATKLATCSRDMVSSSSSVFALMLYGPFNNNNNNLLNLSATLMCTFSKHCT